MNSDENKSHAELLQEVRALRKRLEVSEGIRVYESTPLAYQSLDAEGKILLVNTPWLDMLGYTREQVIGRPFSDFITEDSLALLNKRFPLFCQQGAVHNADFTMIAHDGSLIEIEINGTIDYTKKGDVGCTHCMLINVTERQQAARRLKASESRFRSLFDSSLDGIAFSDTKGKILDVNPPLCQMLGMEREDLIGRHFLDITPSQDHDIEREFQKKLWLNGAVLECTKRLQHKAGGQLTISARGWINSDENGPNGIWTVIRDMSNVIRTEEALRQSESQYRHIVETANEGIIGLDADFRVVFNNPKMQEFLGYTNEELIGTSIYQIIHPDERETHAARLIQRKLGQEQRYECCFLRKDGQRVWGLVSASPIMSVENKFTGSFGMITDITERKHAEERFRLTQFSVDKAPLSIYWVDALGHFIYVNDTTCFSLGYSRTELLRLTISDINPRIPVNDWKEVWLDRKAKSVSLTESIHQKKDGSHFPVGITSYYVEYLGREMLFSYAYDLTERDRAERVLKRSQDLLNEAQRISMTGGWDVDIPKGNVFWTKGQCRLHRVHEREHPSSMKEYFKTFIHPEDRKEVARAWGNIFLEKAPAELEYRANRADGTQAIFQSTGIPVLDEKGKVCRIYGSNRDVTKERNAERELRHSHNRLLTILDGMDADIYVSDLDTDEVLFMNEHMKHFFSGNGDTKKCYAMFQGIETPCPHCPKPHLFENAGTPRQTIVSEQYNSLTKRWYLNHDRAIEWLEGRMVHMHMAADITNLKEMENQLKDATARAETANITKNEFLANMSHEIRTPLNGMLGMLQVLQLTNLEEEQYDYLITALDSGRNLLQILNDILDLSKIESGKLEMEEEETNLPDLLKSVVSVFQHIAAARGITMTLTVDKSLPSCFMVDKGRLRQILFNLVGNAAKFTDSGTIEVAAYPLPIPDKVGRTRIFFSVSDTGIGIPEDKIHQIFDPFTQVDGSFARKYHGTGLGLDIVRRLVSLMEGTITVDSEENIGSTMAFTVAAKPLLHEDACSTSQYNAAEHVPLNILVAEDEHVNRIVIERLLAKQGHSVTCAENGEAALDILGIQPFDCVLMDIQMPGMDGLETTRAIREQLGLKVPVIALTAHAMKGDRQRFLDAGMDGYLAKPFDLKELHELLSQMTSPATKQQVSE